PIRSFMTFSNPFRGFQNSLVASGFEPDAAQRAMNCHHLRTSLKAGWLSGKAGRGGRGKVSTPEIKKTAQTIRAVCRSWSMPKEKSDRNVYGETITSTFKKEEPPARWPHRKLPRIVKVRQAASNRPCRSQGKPTS